MIKLATPIPGLHDNCYVRRQLMTGVAGYAVYDEARGLWLALFDPPDELDAAVDMVLLRFNAKEVP